MSQSTDRVTHSDIGDPVLVEVIRGDLVESYHRAAVAVVDAEGCVVVRAGDIGRPIYARSAIKFLQALPLVESGAADAYGLRDREIALACASHSGEPPHVDTVTQWLKLIGCSVDDLECGIHLPYAEQAFLDLVRAGKEPTPAHNNCSGKHAGFLTVCRHLDYPIEGYIRFDHPIQQRVLQTLEAMTGVTLSAAPRGVDGCGIPVIGVSLRDLAHAMARLVAPHDQSEARRTACARVCRAVAAEPFMIAGSNRLCTEIVLATGGRALVKTGAEGVYCGALPDLGLGIAVKVTDGATRAGEVLMGRLLRHFGIIDGDQVRALSERLEPPIRNRAGMTVGMVRIAATCPF